MTSSWNIRTLVINSQVGPLWVQGIEYPNCPVCNQKMRLVFQLDSEDNLPFMFGDVGCGHITQCKTHKTQVAFGWACS